jgi:tRNA threonylcarbamoyladenosine biosynthesis protein TsaE
MREYFTKNEADTIKLGEKIAGALKKGDVIAVTGDLGAGKTVFVKGIARGLSIYEHITSPTFTLIHSYEGSETILHHFDVYRISEEELFEIGFDEYIYSDDICIIEWADLIKGMLPRHTKWVHIERTQNDYNERKITLKGWE